MYQSLIFVFISSICLTQINCQIFSLNELVEMEYRNTYGNPDLVTESSILLSNRGMIETVSQKIDRLFTTPAPGTSNFNGVMVPTSATRQSQPATMSTIPHTTSQTTEIPLPPGEMCLNGICVPFQLCSNNSLITDGNGIITPRFGSANDQCHYLESCCAKKDVKTSASPIIPNLNPQRQCGYRNSGGVGFRITDNGNEAQYAEFPWMVAVLVEEEYLGKGQSLYQCGGALIHPKVVLTAAHCSNGKTADVLKIRAGEWDIQTANEIFPHQDRNVSEIINHEEYYGGGLFNDISLLILSNEIDLAENVNTVCLPPQNLNFDGSRCFATGWGKDVFSRQGKYQVILKKVELPIVPNQSCQQSLRTTAVGVHFNLHESFICAGGEYGKDTCNGDGGSPLVCPIYGIPNRYYQTGIVSWGMGCGSDQLPGVYVNVAMFINWIDEKFRLKRLETSYYRL